MGTKSRGAWGVVCESRGRLRNRGDSSVRSAIRTGTGAIRQEFFINSRLSAPQAPGTTPCACPIRLTLRALGISNRSHRCPWLSHTTPHAPLDFCVLEAVICKLPVYE
ncbi:MAG: hypothetical protein ACLRPV_14540 [Lacrimispora saccharolytica]